MARSAAQRLAYGIDYAMKMKRPRRGIDVPAGPDCNPWIQQEEQPLTLHKSRIQFAQVPRGVTP